MKFKKINGTTPRDIDGLIPTHITNTKEIDQWEFENIINATKKYLTGKRKYKITVSFILKIHKDMFDKTYEWAGKIRISEKGIGISKSLILEELKKLEDDIAYWNKHNTYTIFEQSVRIHHRLSQIHPFNNGNGRHARLVSNIFLYSNNNPIVNWPSYNELQEDNQLRKEYIKSLKEADGLNYKPLEEFTKKYI